MRRSIHWQMMGVTLTDLAGSSALIERCRLSSLFIIRILWILIFFLLQAGFISPVLALDIRPPRGGLHFNAGWDYLQRGGEGRETTSLFSERYGLSGFLGQGLGYQPTSALSASAGVGYSRTASSRGQGGVSEYENWGPFLGLGISNDIFTGQVTGHAGNNKIIPPSGNVQEFSSKSWDATLATNWGGLVLVPSIRLNASEAVSSNVGILSESDQIPHPRRYNSMAVDWNLIFASLVYSYTDNYYSDSAENFIESKSESARLSTGRSFFDKHLSFGLSGQYQQSTSTLTIASTTPEGSASIRVGGITEALVTDPLTVPDPFNSPNLIDVVLNDIPGLRNSDFGDAPAPLSVDPDYRVALGFKFPETEEINLLKFHISTPITDAQAANMQWSLYARDQLGTGWELIETTVPTNFDPVVSTIYLTISSKEDEIMLVAINNTGLQLEFTEIEAFSQRQDNSERIFTATSGNVGMRVKFTDDLNLSSGLSLSHGEHESNGELISEADYQSIRTSLHWNPGTKVSQTINFNQTSTIVPGQDDKISRNYSLSLSTIPFPTINTNFGASHNEAYIGDRKISANNNYSLNTTAAIYPDMRTSLAFQTSEHSTFNSEGSLINKNTSFSTNMDLHARLRKSVTANISAGYSKAKRHFAAQTFEAASARYGMQYRPSPLLALTGTYTTTLIGSGSDSYSISLNLAAIRTSKTTLNVAASHNHLNTSSESLSMNGSWRINDNLMLLSNGQMSYTNALAYVFFVSVRFNL